MLFGGKKGLGGLKDLQEDEKEDILKIFIKLFGFLLSFVRIRRNKKDYDREKMK